MRNRFIIKICSVVMVFFMAGLVPLQIQAATALDYSAVFDADYYYNTYADLQSAIGKDDHALLQHFITYGMNEGRSGNSEFNVKVYMNNYSDLRQAFGTQDLKSYYLHYIKYGKTEGRSAKGTVTVQNDTNINTNAVTNVIGSYSTAYDPSQSRAVNIALAVSKINGVVVQPGQSFSFSNTLGPRTVENGYVEAPTFVNRTVVSGIGGGICQVSSTTYAAMLQSGIKATQRHAHSLPVSYIPAGMDATIVEGIKDLTFTNTFNYPLVIHASAENGVLTVSFSS